MIDDQDETVDEVEPVESRDRVNVHAFEEPFIEIGAVTHPGAVRARNEDQFAIIRRRRVGEVLASSLEEVRSHDEQDEAWMLVVADGLGGQVSGQIASATAVRAVLKLSGELSSWVMRPMGSLREDIEERIGLYCEAISREMHAKVKADPSLNGMATTMTTAYLFGRNVVVANVGDSRSYLIRDQELKQITKDHTLEQKMKESGLPNEVTHAYRNVVTRCFDTSGNPAQFDLFHFALKPGDRLLLCSDGLTDMVPDNDLLGIIQMADSTAEACRMMTATALRNGGKDNITLVLVHLKDFQFPGDQDLDDPNTSDSTIQP